MLEPKSPGRTYVVLIHGTWARNAAWTRPGSWFRQELCTALASRGIVDPIFVLLEWTGANSHPARAQASRWLCAMISSLRVGETDLCMIVGHSHGGNVALHAIVHDDEVRAAVDGVVTLATPFLLLRPEGPLVAQVAAGLNRSAAIAATLAAGSMLSFVALPPFLLIFHKVAEWELAFINVRRNWLVRGCSWLFSSVTCRSTINVTTGALSATVAILITLLILVVGQMQSRDEHEARQAAAGESMRRYGYLEPSHLLDHTPILALSAPVDEALQILDLSWWAHRLHVWSLRVAVLVSLVGGAAATMAMLFLISMYEQRLVGTDAYGVLSSASVALAKIALVPLAFAAGSLVGWIVRFAASLPAFGLGSDVAANNLYWTVRASRHPVGAALATRRGHGLRGLLKTDGLMIHSRLYRSPEAVRDIADFAAELRTGPKPGERRDSVPR